MNVDEFMAKGFLGSLDGESDSDLDLDDGNSDADDADDDGGAKAPGERSATSVDAFMAGALDDSASDEDPAGEARGSEESEEGSDIEELEGEVDRHQASLERLKAAQPEFYKFLQENDKDLLDFAEDNSDEDGSEAGSDGGDASEEMNDEAHGEASVEDEEESSAAVEELPPRRHAVVLTTQRVREWTSLLKKFAVGTFKKSVRALYEACATGEDEQALDGRRRYKLASAETFNALVKSCLRHIPPLLANHLPVANAKPGKGTPLPSTSKGWKKLRSPIKVFLQSILQLIKTLSDPDAEGFVLSCALPLCEYYACFPKLNRLLFKKLLAIWGQAAEGAEQVRVAAFLMIRRLAIVCPYPFIEIALKGIYLSFIRNCKFPTPSIRPTLTFMLNSVAELYSLDPSASYQHAFVYIRQLAVHLRNAISSAKKDNLQQVYNWQYVYALRVWAKLLCEAPGGASKDEGLSPLLYPFVQTTIGAIKLLPIAKYFPLRFHLLRLLIGLMHKTGVYIPLSGLILDTLDCSEMRKKPKPSTGRPLLFEDMLKVPKGMMNGPQFQDATLANALELSLDYFASIACSISFPECVFPDTVRLKAYIKRTKAKHVINKLKPLLEKLEENARFIEGRRAHVSFAPKDTAEIAQWRGDLERSGQSPLMRYHKVWRASEANRKKLLAASQDIQGDDFAKVTGLDAGKLKKAAAAASAAKAAGKNKRKASGTAGEISVAKKSSRVSEAAQDVDDEYVEHDDEDDVLAEFSMNDFDFGDA